MQVRSGGPASGAAIADDVALMDRLTPPDEELTKMAITRDESVAVVNLDQDAVASVPSRDSDRTIVSSVEGVS